MKILFLDQFAEVGGAQRALLELLPALAERNWRACVAAPRDGPLLEQAMRLGASAALLPVGPYGLGRKSARDYVRFLADQPRLAVLVQRLIAREKADLVYINGPRLAPRRRWRPAAGGQSCSTATAGSIRVERRRRWPSRFGGRRRPCWLVRNSQRRRCAGAGARCASFTTACRI